MKIKWIGKYDGSLPTSNLPPDAKPLGKITSKSALYIIPILGIMALFVLLKTSISGIRHSRLSFYIGVGIALVFTAMHELLHAICFPKHATIEMFYTNKGLGTTSICPLSKRRFIVMNLCPGIILGIIPFIIWLFIPLGHVAANSILFAFALFHFGASYADFQNVYNAIRHVPNGATMQISGDQFYWYLSR